VIFLIVPIKIGMRWGLHVILNPWISPMAIIVMPLQGIFEVSKYFNFGERGNASLITRNG